MDYQVTTINRQLIQRLEQDVRKTAPQNKLCELLAIRKDDKEARYNLFRQKQVRIRSVQQPKLILILEISHNEQKHKISFKYDDRVGRSNNGKRIRKIFASLPEFDLEMVMRRYKEIAETFSSGGNWFEELTIKIKDSETLEDQYPNYLLFRQSQVERGLLDYKTQEGDVGRWTNHISKISMKDGSLFCKRSLKTIKRSDIIEFKQRLMVTPGEMIKGKTSVNFTRSASVINRCIHNLKTFFDWAEDSKVIKEGTCPVYRIETLAIPVRKKKLNYQELGRFMKFMLTNSPRGRSSPKVTVAIYLLWITGQRAAEIVKIKWNDIKIDETGDKPQRILYIKNKKGKRKNDELGENIHALYLSEEVEKLLVEIPRLANNDYIFWTDRQRKHGHGYMTPSSLNCAVKKICIELGVERWSPHDIKRSLVTHDKNKYGMDAVKMQTGNKSEKILNKHYDKSISEDHIDEEFYINTKSLQKKREAEIAEYVSLPSIQGKVINLIQKKSKSTIKTHRQDRYRQKILEEHGISPSQYHKRKREGYYDKKA